MASRKIVLVTGGNNGIGYEIVKALLESEKTYHILMGSRSAEKAKTAIKNLKKEVPKTANTVEILQVDLTSDESIEKAFEQVKSSHGYINILINNAGAAFDSACTTGKMSLRDCFNKAYDVNVSGTHVLTYTFIPLLLASKTRSPSPSPSSSPRLIFVAGLSGLTIASKHYFPTPPQPAGWPKIIEFETIGYRCSKTALNMLMLDWSFKLKEDGVMVWGVGPGFLATDLGGVRELTAKMGTDHPSVGGRLLRSVVEGERDGEVGKLISRHGISPF